MYKGLSCDPGSNETNCIVETRRVGFLATPCWPWPYGDHISPQGRKCRMCVWTWRLCAYDKDLDALMADDWRHNNDGYLAFLGAVKHLIGKVNRGELTCEKKLRGTRKQFMQNEFGEVRKKYVKMFKVFRVAIKEKYKACALPDWQARPENAGLDPHKEGHIVRQLPLLNRGLVTCVIYRIGPKGEYDVDFESMLGMQIDEEISGPDALNAAQAENRFMKGLTNSVGQLADGLEDAEALASAVAACVWPLP